MEILIMRMVNDLIKIANAGGGMILDARPIMTDNLVKIAISASNTSSKIILKNVNNKTTNDLIRIAVAGQGNVIFDFN